MTWVYLAVSYLDIIFGSKDFLFEFIQFDFKNFIRPFTEVRNRLSEIFHMKLDFPSTNTPKSNVLMSIQAHSRFGHYFYSNLYGRAPRGPRGVKKSHLFFYK